MQKLCLRNYTARGKGANLLLTCVSQTHSFRQKGKFLRFGDETTPALPQPKKKASVVPVQQFWPWQSWPPPCTREFCLGPFFRMATFVKLGDVRRGASCAVKARRSTCSFSCSGVLSTAPELCSMLFFFLLKGRIVENTKNVVGKKLLLCDSVNLGV